MKEEKKIFFPGGSKYVGHIKDGLAHGKGSLLFSYGGKFEGRFQSGKPHGKGTFFYSAGKKHGGIWINGMLSEKAQLEDEYQEDGDP